MNHDSVRRQLTAFMEDRLPVRTLKRVEGHLDRCPACREELAALERTVLVLRNLDVDEPPSDLAANVMRRIEAGEGRSPWPARLRAASSVAWAAPLATAAAAAVLVLVVQSVEIEVRAPWAADAPLAASAQLAELQPREADADPGRAAVPLPLRSIAANVPSAPTTVGAGTSLRTRCLRQPGSEACAAWHSWLLGLAVADPPAFVLEADQVPVAARPRWLGDLSRFAVHSGSAAQVADGLRRNRDPRAQQLAPHFEQVAVQVQR